MGGVARRSTARDRHRRFGFTIGCLIAVLVSLCTPVAAGAAAGHSRTERLVVGEVNRARAAHGLAALYSCRRLGRAADRHSADMARNRFFSHASANGDAWSTRLRPSIRARRIGENLAYQRLANRRVMARRVIASWLRSPRHRAVMLSGDYQRVGVGMRIGTIGGSRIAFFTADFASTS